LMRAFRWP
jgi:hypothetical protein